MKLSAGLIKRVNRRDYFSPRGGGVVEADLEKAADTSHISRYPRSGENVRTWRYFTTAKMAPVRIFFRPPLSKIRGIKKKKKENVHAGRYTPVKINQRVNLNITKWTYESENPCFLSEPVYTGMNWWEFELSGRALNALREKVCPIERNYFRREKSALRVVYNGRKSQSFHLGGRMEFRWKNFNLGNRANSIFWKIDFVKVE